jgi:hypothetical protein
MTGARRVRVHQRLNALADGGTTGESGLSAITGNLNLCVAPIDSF